MRRFAAVSLLAVAFLLVAGLPSEAGKGGGHGGGHHGGHHHSHHHHFGGRPHVFIGPRILPGYPYWWDYPPAYYYYPPPIVVPEPPVYIQQQPAPARQEVPWYYCPSAQAYYPWVRSCPEAWIEVPARPK